jgi:predicted amidohydrolase
MSFLKPRLERLTEKHSENESYHKKAINTKIEVKEVGKLVELYNILCAQPVYKPVSFDKVRAKEIIKENLDHYVGIIDRSGAAATAFSAGTPTKIVVFPEASIAGFPLGVPSAKEWMDIGCIYVPGEETDVLAEKAKQYGIYIAINQYELDDEWPGRYFNTTFMIDPKGKIALRYRKICTVLSTNPHDILDDYVKKYGERELFPVIDTPLGKLGCITCCDITFPEISRCVVMNGAEVLLHPTGEPAGRVYRPGWECARRARAFENMAYLASANAGGSVGKLGIQMTRGGSEIIDYDGKVIVRNEGLGEGSASATINIDELRKQRPIRMGSLFIQLRAEVFATYYQRSFWPANQFLKKPMEDLSEVITIKKKAIENWIKQGAVMTTSSSIS